MEQDGLPIQCRDIDDVLGEIDNDDVALSRACPPNLKIRGTSCLTQSYAIRGKEHHPIEILASTCR